MSSVSTNTLEVPAPASTGTTYTSLAQLEGDIGTTLVEASSVNSEASLEALAGVDFATVAQLSAYLQQADIDSFAELNAIVADAQILSQALIDSEAELEGVVGVDFAKISDLSSYLQNADIDTEAELEAIVGVDLAKISDLASFLTSANIDTYAELNALVADATLLTTALIDSEAKLEAIVGVDFAKVSELSGLLAAADINTFAELNALVADVNLIHQGLINSEAALEGIVGVDLAKISDLATYVQTTQIDSEAEIEALAGVDFAKVSDLAGFLQSSNIDTLAELNAIVADANILSSQAIDTEGELEAIVGVDFAKLSDINTIAKLEALLSVDIIDSTEVVDETKNGLMVRRPTQAELDAATLRFKQSDVYFNGAGQWTHIERWVRAAQENRSSVWTTTAGDYEDIFSVNFEIDESNIDKSFQFHVGGAFVTEQDSDTQVAAYRVAITGPTYGAGTVYSSAGKLTWWKGAGAVASLPSDRPPNFYGIGIRGNINTAGTHTATLQFDSGVNGLQLLTRFVTLEVIYFLGETI